MATDVRLENYLRMMSRSLLIWDNVLYGLSAELPPGKDLEQARSLRGDVQTLRQRLGITQDQELIPQGWEALHQELKAFHKQVIHLLPKGQAQDRGHEFLRSMEQLVRELGTGMIPKAEVSQEGMSQKGSSQRKGKGKAVSQEGAPSQG